MDRLYSNPSKDLSQHCSSLDADTPVARELGRERSSNQLSEPRKSKAPVKGADILNSLLLADDLLVLCRVSVSNPQPHISVL